MSKPRKDGKRRYLITSRFDGPLVELVDIWRTELPEVMKGAPKASQVRWAAGEAMDSMRYAKGSLAVLQELLRLNQVEVVKPYEAHGLVVWADDAAQAELIDMGYVLAPMKGNVPLHHEAKYLCSPDDVESGNDGAASAQVIRLRVVE